MQGSFRGRPTIWNAYGDAFGITLVSRDRHGSDDYVVSRSVCLVAGERRTHRCGRDLCSRLPVVTAAHSLETEPEEVHGCCDHFSPRNMLILIPPQSEALKQRTHRLPSHM